MKYINPSGRQVNDIRDVGDLRRRCSPAANRRNYGSLSVCRGAEQCQRRRRVSGTAFTPRGVQGAYGWTNNSRHRPLDICMTATFLDGHAMARAGRCRRHALLRVGSDGGEWTLNCVPSSLGHEAVRDLDCYPCRVNACVGSGENRVGHVGHVGSIMAEATFGQDLAVVVDDIPVAAANGGGGRSRRAVPP